MNYNNILDQNTSNSYGLIISSVVSIRRTPYVDTAYFNNSPLTIDGISYTTPYSSTLPTVTPNIFENFASISLWFYFTKSNFDVEQTIYTSTSISARNNELSGDGGVSRLRKMSATYSTPNVLNFVFSGNIANQSFSLDTDMVIEPEKIYHICYPISSTNRTINNQAGSFLLNGQLGLLFDTSDTSATVYGNAGLHSSSLYPLASFGSSNCNFFIFDFINTRTTLTINQALRLYNSGRGIKLDNYKNSSDFIFCYDNMTLDTLTKKLPFTSNNVGLSTEDSAIRYSTNKEVYDNYNLYLPKRSGSNVTYNTNLLPVGGLIQDYFYDGATYVECTGLTGSFGIDNTLDQVIPDSIMDISITGGQLIGSESNIGMSSSNYSQLVINGLTASTLNIWGSKKDYRVSIKNSTIPKIAFYRTPVNSGLLSISDFSSITNVYLSGNRTTEYVFGSTPSTLYLNQSWINYASIFNTASTFYYDETMVGRTGYISKLSIGNTPTGVYYEITNSDALKNGVSSFRSEYEGVSPFNITTIDNAGSGGSGLSSSLVKPLSFSNSTILQEVMVSSSRFSGLVLPGTYSNFQVLKVLNSSIDIGNITNINLQTNLRTLQLHNLDRSTVGTNVDLSIFPNLSQLQGYFTGNLTLPSTNNLTILYLNRAGTSLGTDVSGTVSTGLVSLNRIPLSSTQIYLSQHSNFIGITGTGGIDFGVGRTTSIAAFLATNGSYGFITVPTASSTFQFTSIFNISGTTQCLCPTFSGITWSMFPTVNTNFNVSNTNHTSITDLGLPLGTTIRSSGINISQTFSSLAMGLTALANTIENIYTNWFNFATSSITKSLTWNHPLVTTTTGITPSGFTLGVSDGTFSVDNVTRIRELKYVLTTQTISAGTASLKYRWSFTP